MLPKKFWGKQDYLLYVYDVIADMIRQADRKELSSFHLTFETEQQAQSFEKAEDMLEWMDKNNKHDISLKMFESHVFFSLLKDFCFYIYESISCASRGKVTVAYSLLRKPLRDNLLYLEWLLADKEEFYKSFLYGDVQSCDVANYKVFDRTRIRKIIKEASSKSYMGQSVNSNNIVYRFRFNSKEDIGLQRIWNQSMHLVTSSPNYATENGNLNFVFADAKIWDDYWNYYYLVVPQIMAYALEICEALFLNVCNADTFELLLNRIIRINKYMKVIPETDEQTEVRGLAQELIKTLEESNVTAQMKCQNCSKDIAITTDVIKQMIENWAIICPHCQQEHNICKYYNEIEYSVESDTDTV